MAFACGASSYQEQASTISDSQLEAGTTATSYTPYGCIGLYVGDNLTPIDLQGHTLASLPDGTRDVLRIDGAGNVTIEKNVGSYTILGSESGGTTQVGSYYRFYSSVIADMQTPITASQGTANGYCSHSRYAVSYGGEYVHAYVVNTKRFIVFSEGNNPLSDFSGATIYYQLAAPTTINLGTITLPKLTNPCELAIYASLDPTWAIGYERDLNVVVGRIEASIAPVEGVIASANYSVGSYFVYDSQLYRVTTAIATGEAIRPGTNCTQTTVMAELVMLTA